MARSRYTITEPDKPHFLTCSVVAWLPVFSKPQAAKIIFDSWQYQRKKENLRLYGYVVMEDHLHFIAQLTALDKTLHSFKAFTARRIIDYLEQNKIEYFLERLRFSKRAHKSDREYQFWQEGSHAELILDDNMMREKLEYIHNNPVKKGYVSKQEHWRYSSAIFYAGGRPLVEVDLLG